MSKNEEIDWNQAMGFVKTAEKQYPVPQKDLEEIMNMPGVRPTFNFASIVNESPVLQRFDFTLLLKLAYLLIQERGANSTHLK